MDIWQRHAQSEAVRAMRWAHGSWFARSPDAALLTWRWRRRHVRAVLLLRLVFSREFADRHAHRIEWIFTEH